MIWLSNKYKLSYYTKCNDTVDCYCDLLVYPTDLILQGSFGKGSGNYSISIEIWTPDGNTALSVDTSYFDYYIGYNRFTGNDFFVAKLRSITPTMCTNKCFIVRVGVFDNNTNRYVFANYTDRYCIADCCDVANGISVIQDGNEIGGTQSTSVGATQYHCGHPLIRIYSFNDCNDVFNGELYTTPSIIYQGTGFDFYRVTNFRGQIKMQPSIIERTYSYNCNLQYTSNETQWLVEGWEFFPEWKMIDLESHFKSAHIIIDDFIESNYVKYKGDKLFDEVGGCCKYFKLNTVLTECIERQYYGCQEPCNIQGAYDRIYVFPTESPTYTEQGVLIATESEGIINYLRAQPGVTNVTEISQSPVLCDLYLIIGVNGGIPLTLYLNGVSPQNRIFPHSSDILNEICGVLDVSCANPQLGEAEFNLMSCDSPVAGVVELSSAPTEEIITYGFGDWVEGGAIHGERSGNSARINILFDNSVITEPVPETIFLANEIIGSISPSGYPTSVVILNNENNGTIPADVTITIDTSGVIRYTGEPTSGDGSGVHISISDIYYNIS